MRKHWGYQLRTCCHLRGPAPPHGRREWSVGFDTAHGLPPLRQVPELIQLIELDGALHRRWQAEENPREQLSGSSESPPTFPADGDRFGRRENRVNASSLKKRHRGFGRGQSHLPCHRSQVAHRALGASLFGGFELLYRVFPSGRVTGPRELGRWTLCRHRLLPAVQDLRTGRAPQARRRVLEVMKQRDYRQLGNVLLT